jgi:hypothetical protein
MDEQEFVSQICRAGAGTNPVLSSSLLRKSRFVMFSLLHPGIFLMLHLVSQLVVHGDGNARQSVLRHRRTFVKMDGTR